MNMIRIMSKFVRNKYTFASAPAIIRNSQGEILLAKRKDNCVFYPSLWGLPGGMTEYDEKIEDSVKREVGEETGVKIKIIKRGRGIYEHLPTKECPFHIIEIPYYAKIINGTPEAKDETQEVKWFKPKVIGKMKLAYEHKKVLRGEGLI